MKIEGSGCGDWGAMRGWTIGRRVFVPWWRVACRSAAACAMLLWAFILPSTPAQAGVLAAATRVISTQASPAQSLMLANANDYPVIVQTWVDQGEGDPSVLVPFLSLPAVFRLQPKETQGIRILLADAQTLPQDRESVFWLNLYEIPPTLHAGAATSQDNLALAMNTQIKIFYRPEGLPETDVAARLRFALTRVDGVWGITCHNPTPYYASLTTLAVVDGSVAMPVQGEMDMMTAPFSQRRYVLGTDLPSGQTLRYFLVNDAGFPQSFEVALEP